MAYNFVLKSKWSTRAAGHKKWVAVWMPEIDKKNAGDNRFCITRRNVSLKWKSEAPRPVYKCHTRHYSAQDESTYIH